jgi:NitT/TauT family transport system substrate-binding protein
MLIPKFRKYILAVFLALGLMQIWASSGGGQSQSGLTTLKVLLVPFIGSAPFFIGEEEGFFAEQGLQIKFIKMVRSADGIPALTHGELDIWYGSTTTSFLNVIARGGKIRCVAEKGYLSPTGCAYSALLARRSLVEEGKLNGPAHLNGRRIDLNPVSVEAYYVEKLLNTVGLSLNDIVIVDVPTPVMPDALKKGTIDVVATVEPWITFALQTGHAVLWMPAQKVIPGFQLSTILFGPTLLEKNPEVGKRFMIACLKAVRQFNKGKTERNLEIIAKHTGLDKELLKRTCWPSLRDDGKMNIESVLDFQSWAVKKGFQDKVVSPDQFWDPSFIEYANKVLNKSVP